MLLEKILKALDYNHIGMESFQNYAKFYDNYVPNDPEFNNKISTIYNCIETERITDITQIADKANCTVDDTILKIRYLINKCIISDYYIDTVNKIIMRCNMDDQRLLSKYTPYIYYNHMQIDEIARIIPSKLTGDYRAVMDEVFNELKYLDEKKLLNGIKIDSIDRQIIYYAIEKRKKINDYRTVHCPNCGSLNDVAIGQKVRCGYCNTIIKCEIG